MQRRSAVLLVLLAATLGSCDYVSPLRPVLGYENNDQSCSDGIDNDVDGRIDCQDIDCFFDSAQCGQDVPGLPDGRPENTLPRCTDQVDNDNNGQYDCG